MVDDATVEEVTVVVIDLDVEPEQTCVNGNGTDSEGDGCDWYTWYPESCGLWDTDTWSSLDQCCACLSV